MWQPYGVLDWEEGVETVKRDNGLHELDKFKNHKIKTTMQVRITFSAEVIITGCDMGDIKRKFEDMPLFSQAAEDCGAEYCETLLVEDADDFSDLSYEYINA